MLVQYICEYAIYPHRDDNNKSHDAAFKIHQEHSSIYLVKDSPPSQKPIVDCPVRKFVQKLHHRKCQVSRTPHKCSAARVSGIHVVRPRKSGVVAAEEVHEREGDDEICERPSAEARTDEGLRGTVRKWPVRERKDRVGKETNADVIRQDGEAPEFEARAYDVR